MTSDCPPRVPAAALPCLRKPARFVQGPERVHLEHGESCISMVKWRGVQREGLILVTDLSKAIVVPSDEATSPSEIAFELWIGDFLSFEGDD